MFNIKFATVLANEYFNYVEVDGFMYEVCSRFIPGTQVVIRLFPDGDYEVEDKVSAGFLVYFDPFTMAKFKGTKVPGTLPSGIPWPLKKKKGNDKYALCVL